MTREQATYNMLAYFEANRIPDGFNYGCVTVVDGVECLEAHRTALLNFKMKARQWNLTFRHLEEIKDAMQTKGYNKQAANEYKPPPEVAPPSKPPEEKKPKEPQQQFTKTAPAPPPPAPKEKKQKQVTPPKTLF